jgi:hypothetical protein
MNVRDFGIEPRTFFLFKMSYEDNPRFTLENVEDFNDFEEFIPTLFEI